MRLLIIPDIHNHVENADYWLRTQEYERVIFMGDFFDHYGDNVTDARRTARWLRDRMDSSDDVFLLGNHDASYMFPNNSQLECPGFTKAKARGIWEILKPEHWRRFRLVHAEQGWLMSHAGFHPVWIDEDLALVWLLRKRVSGAAFHPAWNEEATVERIMARCDKAMQNAKMHVVDPILGMGQDRGGGQLFGGPLWMDWDNLLPIQGINQIVGHTPGSEVREKITPASKNYCLDVSNASVAAILSEGKLTILRRR
jgi:hypothetical protein